VVLSDVALGEVRQVKVQRPVRVAARIFHYRAARRDAAEPDHAGARLMKLEQVSNSCYAVLNEKNRVCDANSSLINLGGGVVIDTQSDLAPRTSRGCGPVQFRSHPPASQELQQ
jgi:3-dehydroquinate synthetase